MRRIMLIINEDDLQTIFANCSREYPNEACGILAGMPGSVEQVYVMTNARPGPASYEMDPEEQFRVMKAIRRSGLGIVGIYHSHPSGPAYPSGIDVERAYWPGTLFPNFPDAAYMIVSLAHPSNPAARTFAISDGQISEVELIVRQA